MSCLCCHKSLLLLCKGHVQCLRMSCLHPHTVTSILEIFKPFSRHALMFMHVGMLHLMQGMLLLDEH